MIGKKFIKVTDTLVEDQLESISDSSLHETGAFL
ncbi:hypothetical protein SAMN05192559_101629 [Halobacillus karajensis]|nr:hypothetical protein SAMN05192559_101629 [Halobacillus karajensis]